MAQRGLRISILTIITNAVFFFPLALPANELTCDASSACSSTVTDLADTCVSMDHCQADTLLQDDWIDRLGDRLDAAKQCHHLPITMGAWHWWHVNNDGPFPDGYAIPPLSGTYSYYVTGEPEWETGCWGTSYAGAYFDVRFRDGGDPVRRFVPDSQAWVQSAFAWALTDYGLWKAGVIGKRFGLDWDGSWWGPLQYFDGYKLDTDWGIALEHAPVMTDGFKMDRYLQFFFQENNVSGALTGADPESVVGSTEKNTLVVRLVPTWQVGCEGTLALGLSALAGHIENDPFVRLVNSPVLYPTNGDEGHVAWAVDLTYAAGFGKVYAEALQSYGVRNPVRFISGGPSRKTTEVLIGAERRWGPLTCRFNYSAGFDDDPSATQQLFVPGCTLSVNRHIDLWLEYVRQHTNGHPAANTLEFEDGFQLLVHWHF